MIRLTIILLIIQLALFSASCTKYDQRIQISDPKQSQVLLLQKKPNQKIVTSMGIHCYGQLEGAAELVLMLNGAPYKTEKLKGKVNIKWGGDWYSDSMELKYQPSNVTAGQLTIDYALKDL